MVVGAAVTDDEGDNPSTGSAEADDSGGSDSGSNDGSSDDGSGGSDDGGGSGSNDSSNDEPLKILEHEAYEDGMSAGVKGKVKNVSGQEQSYVAVEAKFFYEDERVGEGLDNTTDLADGRVWSFDCMMMESDQQFDEYEIEASTSPF